MAMMKESSEEVKKESGWIDMKIAGSAKSDGCAVWSLHRQEHDSTFLCI
jgi:hypothetical protein